MLRIVICTLILFALSLSAQTVQNSLLLENATGPIRKDPLSMQTMYIESPVDSNYTLGPGDIVDVIIDDHYTMTTGVAADGRLSIDGIGAINVNNMTLLNAQRAFNKLGSQKFPKDYCQLQLAQLKRFKVGVYGAVAIPGQYGADPQTRLSQMLRHVGGLANGARSDSVLILRNNDTIAFNYYEAARFGTIDQDPELRMGDRIFVPFSKIGESVSIRTDNGLLTAPFTKGRTIYEYMTRMGLGDVSRFGNAEILVKESDGKIETHRMDEISTIVLNPSSLVEFSMIKSFVYVGGSTVSFGKQNYDPSWKAVDYIAAAGISVVTGGWKQVTLLRNGVTMSIDPSTDVIMPGDYIEIPRSYYETFKDFTLFAVSLLSVVSSAVMIYVNFR